MKLKEAVRKLIECHPDMFHNRGRALELLFGIIGTGMEWGDGEVIDKFEENYLNSDGPKWWSPREHFAKEQTHAIWSEKLRESMPAKFDTHRRKDSRRQAEMCADQNAKMQQVLDRIDKAVKETPTPQSYYPLCDLCHLMNIPDDVKPDWLDGAEEFANLVLETDPKWLDRDKWPRGKNNHKWAKKALKKITALRKKRK